MIPSKLKLNNFMSYRGETDILDFDDWSVACITGDNGNGKSAILEAITWVCLLYTSPSPRDRG